MPSTTPQQILSDIVVYSKYAKFIPEISRRETWDELCHRSIQMHVRRYPELKSEIQQVFTQFVMPKKVLPSMRSLQFAGKPIELSNNRLFNCAFLPADHTDAFSETMFLLLGGSGVGYSVQRRDIDKLPSVQGVKERQRRFLIGDSIEGWADAIKILVEAHVHGKSDPLFDFRDIRKKGAMLITSGGKAPGPAPLKVCLEHLRTILVNAAGRKLYPIEAHDMLCHIADAVLSGGIRRAAMISLFDADDMDMLTCKTGAWFELNPQRGRANNSIVLHRTETTEAKFTEIWERIEASNAGEPGVFWTNDYTLGTNPCCEISLKPFSFCNLTEVNASNITGQNDLNSRTKAAAFIGTLQAGYTNFHYLREIWRETTEADSLIGVGMTGIGSGNVLTVNLTEAANVVNAENKRVAALIGIKCAARTTCVKPSGSTSAVVGSASGIHAWHNDYYIRRVRVGKNEPLYAYMMETLPELVEDCYFKPHIEAIMSFPQKAPSGSIIRTESFLDLLNRVKKFNNEWIRPGHAEGNNCHNVSCTISLKSSEWKPAGQWMWANREYYTGIAVLPYNGGTYRQTPFEDCTEAVYNEMLSMFHAVDLTKIVEYDDITDHKAEAACGGGQCEIK